MAPSNAILHPADYVVFKKLVVFISAKPLRMKSAACSSRYGRRRESWMRTIVGINGQESDARERHDV